MSYQPMLHDQTIFCTNLVKRIESQKEFNDRNTIKVVMDHQGYALYFSREPIPTVHGNAFSDIFAYKQVCVIPFMRDSLLEFARMDPTKLEQTESIDMLRLKEHGGRVKLVECTQKSHSVDAPADVEVVELMMQGDPVLTRYA